MLASTALQDAFSLHNMSAMPPLADVAKPNLIVRCVDLPSNIDRISHDYRAMWEYDPGEERAPKESDKLLRDFLHDRKDATAVAAYSIAPDGKEHWVGSAFGYGKRRDHPFEPTNQAAIASVYVDEDARLQGVATKMVQELKQHFQKNHYEGVQLYASPEGRAVYSKIGFTDGDELRLKSSSFQSAQSAIKPDSAINVREADLNDPLDRAFVLNNERRDSGVTKSEISDDDAHRFIESPNEHGTSGVGTTLIAFEHTDSGDQRLGSAVAGTWKYPVPNTFEDSSRRDLFVPALRINDGVAAPLAQRLSKNSS